MKMFQVTAKWHIKREKKNTYKTAIIIAETTNQAISKFKEMVYYPQEANIYAFECDDGIYICELRKEH